MPGRLVARGLVVRGAHGWGRLVARVGRGWVGSWLSPITGQGSPPHQDVSHPGCPPWLTRPPRPICDVSKPQAAPGPLGHLAKTSG